MLWGVVIAHSISCDENSELRFVHTCRLIFQQLCFTIDFVLPFPLSLGDISSHVRSVISRGMRYLSKKIILLANVEAIPMPQRPMKLKAPEGPSFSSLNFGHKL